MELRTMPDVSFTPQPFPKPKGPPGKTLNITDANRDELFAKSIRGLPIETLQAMLRRVEAKLRRPTFPEQAARYATDRDAIQAAIDNHNAA